MEPPEQSLFHPLSDTLFSAFPPILEPAPPGRDAPEDLPPLLPLALAHRPLLEPLLAAHPAPVSDMSFAVAWMWAQKYELRWMVLHGCLCLVSLAGGPPSLFLPPMGPGDRHAALQAASDWMRRVGCDELLIDLVSAADLPLLEGWELEPRSGDYIYTTASMISLAGNALASKRQARNAFLRNHPSASTGPLRAEDIEPCQELLQRWLARETGDLVVDQRRQAEAGATSRLLEALHSLDLRGMVLRVESALVGFTIGEALGPDQASILVEKVDPACKGGAQLIFSEFCRQHWSDRPLVNAGDDWEIPSLAFTKQSYRPLTRLEKWTARRRL